ncbi:endo alpha-1,4 polygalactosaminidase [Kineosporia sp. J2-2]|uniref:Endo alpha-1,4 polygalactosaminidase n=1 Tax=Kineosporia corallincola TaxID=2835133 RepID=A0ABS5TKR8_9ACTN|nr:endo alpha-1,4 polygalactosaminidase [Kineosporia corallincola]MBT0771691.1 endo alpha-1,4 polygalactosaminidase [Kineosporia corallincola]
MSPAPRKIGKPLAALLAAVAVAGAGTLFALGTQGADAAPAGSAASAATKAAYELPPADARFDYQLGGAYKPAKGVKVVTRDRTAAPAKGKYGICYVNAFQAQPDATGWWKKKHPDLLLKNASGAYVVDGDWDELILDTSSAAKRKKLAAIVGGWIDGCAEKGYQAVEPDNLDSYTRSQKLLTRSDAVAFTKLLAARAHRAGLAIGQKNTSELGTRGKKAGLDFAVTEECGRYDECGDYTKVYGNHVIVIEYTKKAFAKTCDAYGDQLSVVRRDLDVTPRGSKGYVYQAC